jgi:hypothetical protein
VDRRTSGERARIQSALHNSASGRMIVAELCNKRVDVIPSS